MQMTDMTPEQIEHVERICAELDGLEWIGESWVDDGAEVILPSYTYDLNEIFRLFQKRLSALTFNAHSKLIYDNSLHSMALLEENNPAIALACALVKAEGRWKEVEDKKDYCKCTHVIPPKQVSMKVCSKCGREVEDDQD